MPNARFRRHMEAARLDREAILELAMLGWCDEMIACVSRRKLPGIQQILTAYRRTGKEVLTNGERKRRIVEMSIRHHHMGER